MLTMNANFYRAFEERHRGPARSSKAVSKFTCLLVEALRHLHRDFFVVDLGCGRGEWLELLRDNSVSALGG